MENQGRRNRIARGLLAVTLASAMLGVVAANAVAGPKSKTARQMRVFEHIVDEMLVDSPNWLVQGRDEARGMYVEGHGAIFTFDVSLVNAGWGDSGHGKSWWGWWQGHDDRVIILDDDDDDDDDYGDDEDRASRRRARKEWQARDLKRQERRYTRGKSEVVEMIVDFGDVLTTLADDEWVEIEAFLEGASYFYEKDLEQLSVRAKMADVRAYADGDIDEKTLVERIQTKES